MKNQGDEVKAVFAAALDAHEIAVAAKTTLEAVMFKAMQKLLPTGRVVDLSFGQGKQMPTYLMRVRTMTGNDRGTKRFRIVKVVAVEANPRYPELSRWIADAVPVSQKTGKDMSASSGHVAGQTTVRLHGSLGCNFGPDEPAEDAGRRVVELVAQQTI